MKFFSCFSRQDEDEEGPRKLRRKMVIVGDGACGKTCLVTRMTTKDFVDVGYIPTVFETDVIDVNTGKETVELLIFDTAGQEDYDRLRPFSYDDVNVVLICFSLADPDSLMNVQINWSPEIRHYCGNAPIILVGNKKDLRDAESKSSSTRASMSSLGDATKSNSGANNNSAVTAPESPSDSSKPIFKVNAPVKHSEGALVAIRIGALAYFETSALTGDNVEELLLATTKAAVLGTRKSKKFKPFAETLKSWKSLNALVKTEEKK